MKFLILALFTLATLPLAQLAGAKPIFAAEQ